MRHEDALTVPGDCLVVFVDDVGHEALLPDQQVYGLGGCAVLARDLDRIIRTPWREIRRQVTRSPDTPLHANTFPKEHAAAVGQFFATQLFFRLGAIITIKTTLSPELGGPVPTVAAVLKERIREGVSRTPAKSVTVIFEASERADRLIEDAFQGFGLAEGTTPIPVECCFMRKEQGEPGLEVADFVMHAVQGQVRHINLKLEDRDDITFRLDFKAAFHSVDRTLKSFHEVEYVEAVRAGQPSTDQS